MRMIARKMLKPGLRVLTVMSGILLIVNQLDAQQRQPDRGFKAGNSFAISEIETINTTNGNLMLNIPLAALPAGRGTSPDFPISLHYNSKLWDAKREVRNDGLPDETGNTKYNAEFVIPSEDGGWTIGMG